MSCCAIRAGYFRPWCGIGSILLMACAVSVQESRAAETDIQRVEEDWELVVNQPDASIHSPQITFLMTPSGLDTDRYFQLQLNHAVNYEFSGGGYQLAAVQDLQNLDTLRSSTYQSFVTDDQCVRWTSVMSLSGGEFFFSLKDGYSVDWGAFGGPAKLVRMPANGAANLNGYDPARSLEVVDVGFGANRIVSLVLKTVRLHYADGRIVEVSVNSSP